MGFIFVPLKGDAYQYFYFIIFYKFMVFFCVVRHSSFIMLMKDRSIRASTRGSDLARSLNKYVDASRGYLHCGRNVSVVPLVESRRYCP